MRSSVALCQHTRAPGRRVRDKPAANIPAGAGRVVAQVLLKMLAVVAGWHHFKPVPGHARAGLHGFPWGWAGRRGWDRGRVAGGRASGGPPPSFPGARERSTSQPPGLILWEQAQSPPPAWPLSACGAQKHRRPGEGEGGGGGSREHTTDRTNCTDSARKSPRSLAWPHSRTHKAPKTCSQPFAGPGRQHSGPPAPRLFLSRWEQGSDPTYGG